MEVYQIIQTAFCWKSFFDEEPWGGVQVFFSMKKKCFKKHLKYTSSNSVFDADSEYNISFVQIIIFLTETSKISVKKAQIYSWKSMFPCFFGCFVKLFFKDLGKDFVEPKMLYIMHYIKNPPRLIII